MDRVSDSDKRCAVEVCKYGRGWSSGPILRARYLAPPAVLVPWGNAGVDNVELGVQCKWTGVEIVIGYHFCNSSVIIEVNLD